MLTLSSRRSLRSVAMLLAVVLLLAGCTARHIREAQDSFNRGAAAENRLFASGYDAPDALTTQSTAHTDYRLALAAVRTELSANEADLTADRLLGTARMLEAYCLWRLIALEPDESHARELEADLNARTAAITGAGDELALGERDRVMLAALPGLLDHERGLRAGDYDTAARNFESAATTLSTVAAGLPQQHPMRTYLRIAEIAAYRALQTAAFAYHDATAATDLALEAATKAGPALRELASMAARDSDAKERVRALAMRLGVNDPTR